jgi:hypothetical protein
LTLVSGRTTLTSFDMTSLTRTMPAISLCLQTIPNHFGLSFLFVLVYLEDCSFRISYKV